MRPFGFMVLVCVYFSFSSIEIFCFKLRLECDVMLLVVLQMDCNFFYLFCSPKLPAEDQDLHNFVFGP